MSTVKKLLYCLFALFVSAIILYADLLCSFPSEITMLQNEMHNTSLGLGVYIGNIPQSICTSDSAHKVTPLQNGEYEATLKLADTLPFRKIKLKVTSAQNLYASGELIGLRIYNNGLIVTGTSTVNSDGKACSPAEKVGIQPGDVILEINGNTVTEGEQVQQFLKPDCVLTVLRNNSIKKINITPVRDDSDGKLRIGIWVRDSTAGIGTLTFYNSENGSYGSLGHPISDSETGVMFDVYKGSVEKSKVISITRGTSGTPGEITGSFPPKSILYGTVTKNCASGVFGKISPDAEISAKSYPIGVMSQVKEGKATILSTVDDSVKEYDIKILRSMPFGSAGKGMMIEITDPDLLRKTGGIIQGMSGSPIIQNGKIIGAVTHVLVNDPTRGYGIFIENMLKEAG